MSRLGCRAIAGTAKRAEVNLAVTLWERTMRMERRIPPALWISIAVLAVASVMQLAIGLRGGRDWLFVAVLVNLVLLAGLAYGRKWALVATLVLAIRGFIMATAQGVAHALHVLVINGLVAVPVLFSIRFFFPERLSHPSGRLGRWLCLLGPAAKTLSRHRGSQLHPVRVLGEGLRPRADSGGPSPIQRHGNSNGSCRNLRPPFLPAGSTPVSRMRIPGSPGDSLGS